MEELYLDDSDFEAYKARVDKINSAIEARLLKIIEQLNNAYDGIEAGAFHDNLVTYTYKLSLFTNQLECMTKLMTDDATNFCTEIEDLDTM